MDPASSTKPCAILIFHFSKRIFMMPPQKASRAKEGRLVFVSRKNEVVRAHRPSILLNRVILFSSYLTGSRQIEVESKNPAVKEGAHGLEPSAHDLSLSFGPLTYSCEKRKKPQ